MLKFYPFSSIYLIIEWNLTFSHLPITSVMISQLVNNVEHLNAFCYILNTSVLCYNSWSFAFMTYTKIVYYFNNVASFHEGWFFVSVVANLTARRQFTFGVRNYSAQSVRHFLGCYALTDAQSWNNKID